VGIKRTPHSEDRTARGSNLEQGDYITGRTEMTYEEIKAKVDALSDEALKLDKIDDILKEAGTVLEKKDISCLTRIALEIGYLKQLNDAYKEVRYLWLHIYNLKRDLETEGGTV
jgi:hypothetical protein